MLSNGIDKEPLSTLVFNYKKENLSLFAVNIPDHLEDGSNMLNMNDLAILTNATVVTHEENEKNQFDVSILGKVKGGSTNLVETSFYGSAGDPKKIKNQREYLEKCAEMEDNAMLKAFYQTRVNRFKGRSSHIFVGGYTEAETSQNRDVLVDALNSCKSALEGGVISGGGNAYLHALKLVDKLETSTESEEAGKVAFSQAVADLVKSINKGSPLSFKTIRDTVDGSKNPRFGYSVDNNQFVDDCFSAGLVDSLNTVLTAFDDGCSVASMIISVECVVVKEVDYIPPPLEKFKQSLKQDPKAYEMSRKNYFKDDEGDDFGDVI